MMQQLDDLKTAATEMLDMRAVRHRRGHGAWVTYVGLMGAIIVAVGPELKQLETWSEVLSPAGVGAQLYVIGGAIIGWLTPSPMQKKR